MNRQQRRKVGKGKVGGRVTIAQPPKVVSRPKENGVEVDRFGEDVVVTLTEGHVVASLIWTKWDAKRVAEMILAAAEEGGGESKQPEVVSGSGIVIASELPAELP